MKEIYLGNLLGFLALFFYLLTLMPNILRIVFPQVKQSKFSKKLLQFRRQLGVVSFVFTLGHGYIFLQQRQIDFLDYKNYIIYFQGVALIIIFTLLTITSNDISVRFLKVKQWKSLHRLTYLALFLLAYHIIEKMWNHFSIYTPLSLLLIIGTVILFLIRQGVETEKIEPIFFEKKK